MRLPRLAITGAILGLLVPVFGIFEDQVDVYDSSLLVLPTPTTLHVTPFGIATTTNTHVTLLDTTTGTELWSFPFTDPTLVLDNPDDVAPNANTNYYKVKSDEGHFTVTPSGKVRPASPFKPPKPSAPFTGHLSPSTLSPSATLPPYASATISSSDGAGTVATCYSSGLCAAASQGDLLWVAYDFHGTRDVRFSGKGGEDVEVLKATGGGGLAVFYVAEGGTVDVSDLDVPSTPVQASFDDKCGVFARGEDWTLCGGEVKTWEGGVVGCFRGGECLLRREAGGKVGNVDVASGDDAPGHAHHQTENGYDVYVNGTRAGSYVAAGKILGSFYPDLKDKISSGVHVTGDEAVLVKWRGSYFVSVEEVGESLPAFHTNTSKPTGADGNVPKVTTHRPNLSVSVIDSVTLKVLHRISHPDASFRHCVVTDNAFFYTYFNTAHKRTELSSVALFSGLIPPTGITMFSNSVPRREKADTAYDRDRPISLQRTYILPHPVQTLSLTKTRYGILPKSLLILDHGGRMYSVDLRILDPRRPTSKPSNEEKKEGLMQYHPVVTVTSVGAVSYNKTIPHSTAIYTSGRKLESEVLVWTSGWRCLWRRRGFDVLPPDFNKFGLVAALVGLAGVCAFVTWKGKNKRVEEGWA